MGSILVGIDGSDRGRRALDWAVRFARVVGYDVHMLAVIDEAIANKAGVSIETITETATAALEKVSGVLEEEPTVPSSGHLAVAVPDFEATVARLRERGFELEPKRPHWGQPRALAIAPGGHRVELMAAPPASQT